MLCASENAGVFGFKVNKRRFISFLPLLGSVREIYKSKIKYKTYLTAYHPTRTGRTLVTAPAIVVTGTVEECMYIALGYIAL